MHTGDCEMWEILINNYSNEGQTVMALKDSVEPGMHNVNWRFQAWNP